MTLTRQQGRDLAEAIHGARVEDARVEAGVLVLELFHKGTDDDAKRIAVSLSSVVADDWPWPQPGGAT